MPVGVGHAEAADGVLFEVELDQDDRLAADDTAVRVLDVDLSTDEEPDMSMHTEVGPDDGFHVDRPSEPRRINHALDTSRAGTPNLEAHVPHLTKFGAFDRGEA